MLQMHACGCSSSRQVQTTRSGMSGGEPALKNHPTILFYSFDMLIAVEYGCHRDFKHSICLFRDNWNQYNKAPDDQDMGLQEVFKRICLQMCSWALRLYQTLLNYTRSRRIICYSFVCLADRIGQLMRTN